MPVREIKTTLAIDGEKAFKKALEDAGREMRVLQSDLKAIASEFEATGDEQQYLAEKSRTLDAQMRQQENIVEALGRALEEAKKAYGDTAKETDGYRIKLNNATAKMFDLRRASEAANRELEEFGRDSVRIGQQIESGIGDAAEEARHDLKDMFADVAGNLDELRANAAVQTSLQIGGVVVDVVQSVASFVDENAELNRQTAIAKYNVEKAGHSWENIQSLAVDAAAITGDYEATLEAISNLAGVGFENEGLLGAAVDALVGTMIRTGGALNFESLAEDLRASIKNKTPTGTYLEAISEVWGDAIEDDVKKAFEAQQTPEDLIEVALSYLTKAGAQTYKQDFETENNELLEYQRAKIDLTTQWAELAGEVTPIVTDIIGVTSGIVEHLTAFVDGYNTGREKRNKAISEFMTGFSEGVQKPIDFVQSAWEDVSALFADPEGQIETFKASVETQWQQWVSAGSAVIDWIKSGIDTVMGWSQALFDFFAKPDYPEVYLELPGKDFEGLKQELGTFDDTRKRTPEENQAIFDRYDASDPGVRKMYEEINAIYEMLGEDFGVTLKDQTGEDGKEAGAALVDGMAESEENAKVAGQNFMIAVENGITERAPYLYDKIQNILNNAASILNQPVGVPGNSVYSGSGGGNSNITAADRGGMAVLQIDGQTAGRLLYSGVSREGARRTRTAMTIG